MLQDLEILTGLRNYLVSLESLKCWLGGAPGGHLVQFPTCSWTPARTRSGKRWLCLSKSWKHLCGRSHSLSEQPARSLVKKFLQMSSWSLPSHSLWPVPLMHHLVLLRRIWLHNFCSYPSNSCRLFFKLVLKVFIASLHKPSSLTLSLKATLCRSLTTLGRDQLLVSLQFIRIPLAVGSLKQCYPQTCWGCLWRY